MKRVLEATHFRVVDDALGGRRWYLGLPTDDGGKDLDWARLFRGSRPAFGGALRVRLSRPGAPVAFTLAGFDVPVVRAEVMALLEQSAGDHVFGIPVAVEGSVGQFFVLGVSSVLPALDEERSEIMRWEGQGVRPDLAGTYRMVTTIRIDPRATGGVPIFRIRGWEIALIVSRPMRDAIKAQGITGVGFLPA